MIVELEFVSPPNSGETTRTVSLQAGATVLDALTAVGCSTDEAWIVIAEGVRLALDGPLSDGQKLKVYQPIIGG